MTIENPANTYARGKRDALEGKPKRVGKNLTYDYKNGWKHGMEKLRRDAKPVGPDRNPPARCVACGEFRLEKAFPVYDVATDSFYCTDEERMSHEDG